MVIFSEALKEKYWLLIGAMSAYLQKILQTSLVRELDALPCSVAAPKIK